MIQDIIEMARKLGRVPEEDMELLTILCQAAEAEAAGRLRDGVTAEDCGPAYVLGCAWLALSAMAVHEAGSGQVKFTAGEVSIQEESGDALRRARALRLQAETVLGPYLQDSGFVFRGVEG